MPDTPKHPVTLGDLFVSESMGFGSHKKWSNRPATVADLVSALRAEGVLIVDEATTEQLIRAIEDQGWLVPPLMNVQESSDLQP